MENTGTRFLRPVPEVRRFRGKGTHPPPTTVIRLPERLDINTDDEGEKWLTCHDGQSAARFRVLITKERAADLESDFHAIAEDEADALAEEVEV